MSEHPVGATVPFALQFVHPVTQKPTAATSLPIARIARLGAADLAYSGIVTSQGSGSYQLACSATEANGFVEGEYTVRMSAMYSAIGYRAALGGFILASAPNKSSTGTSIVGLIDEALERLSEQRTSLADVPTVAEFDARTLVAADYFDPAVDTVGTVTTVTNMRGTDNASLASALATAQLDLDTLTGADGATLATSQANYAPAKAGDAMALTAGERTTLAAVVWDALTSGMITAGSIGKKLADWVVGTIDTYTGNTKQTADHTADISSILADTNELQTDWVNGGRLDLILDARAAETSITALNDLSAAEVWAYVISDATALTADSVADHLRKTSWVAFNKNVIVDSTGAYTIYKDDGATTAVTGTITDDSTNTTRSAPTW